MNEGRGPWYLLTGLILGAALGVLYAWMVQPVQYTNTKPASLRADFKDQYRTLIAAAYMANGDLVRAKARLELLKDVDVYRVLAEQAQRTLAGGKSLQEARALGLLAVALGQAPATAPPVTAAPNLTQTVLPSPTASITPTLTLTSTQSTPGPGALTASPAATGIAASTPGGTPRPSATATRTPTRLPSLTPTPTPGALFVLKSQDLVCDASQPGPMIQILAYDAAGQGVPGVEVVVSWSAGENHFFTGLQPELGLGYTDFEMAPGVTYTLRLAEGGQPISGLAPAECQTDAGTRQWGIWKVVFEQP